MQNADKEIHIDDTAASGGEKSGHMRWVLGVGLALAIGLMTIIWITGALSQGDVEEEGTVSGKITSQQDDSSGTDSIIEPEDTQSAPATMEGE